MLLRWSATVTYANGEIAKHEFDEFVDLGNWIEVGPDWNEIKTIKVVLLRKTKSGED